MHKVGYPNVWFDDKEVLFIRETMSNRRDEMIEINPDAVKMISNLELAIMRHWSSYVMEL